MRHDKSEVGGSYSNYQTYMPFGTFYFEGDDESTPSNRAVRTMIDRGLLREEGDQLVMTELGREAARPKDIPPRGVRDGYAF